MTPFTSLSDRCQESRGLRKPLKAPSKLLSIIELKTSVYPGFPTDAQALFLSLMTVAKGQSVFFENVFSDRYKYVKELLKIEENLEPFCLFPIGYPSKRHHQQNRYKEEKISYN